MEFAEIIGYGSALLVGLVLGLTGGGGSILTVPVLVYLINIDPVKATAYSLFIVGVSSLVGALKNMQQQMVDYRTAAVFAVPAFTGVYLTRKYFVPALPEKLLTIGSVTLTKDLGIMLFFALIMLLAALSMIRKRAKDSGVENDEVHYNYPLIIVQGLLTGVVTGMVGAGGGFLIIPALVLFAKLPMKRAVATSLLIIAANSLIGFLGDVQNQTIDWHFLLSFTALAVVGIFGGIYLNRFIDGPKLKRGFGYFVLLMGIYMLYKELSLM
jgi:uncharacterized membrane protein YfcA